MTMRRENAIPMLTLQDMIAEDCATYRKRVAELEAALREGELILTALAMLPSRAAVCSDEKLTAALTAARQCLR